MRVMLDARMARHGGIGTYLRHLIPALAASGQLERCCIAGAPHGTAPPASAVCPHPFPAPIYSVQEQWMMPGNPHGAGLWHSPHFNIPLRWHGALVVTIHDLIHVKFPRYARTPLAAPYATFMLRQVARRADAVIAVSETTKQDFCEWTKMAPARVTVIPHGVPSGVEARMTPEDAGRIRGRHGIASPYLLWVSAIRPHKNPLMALRAFARLREYHRIPHALVMVGVRPPWYRAPQDEAVRLGLGNAVRWVGAVPPEELPAFYQGATALVMPSYQEGFCFPVLEAMAAGVPVAASTAPAILELVENAGVTIPPDDVDQWVDSLYNVLIHDDVHRTYQDRGRLRARDFTWERTAARHLDVYRSVLHPG